MKAVFRNTKIELTGLIAWSLLSFAGINISIQFFDNNFIAILISSFAFSFLHSFFLVAYYNFQLSTKLISLFISIYVLLVMVFQALFDTMIRLEGKLVSIFFYLLIVALVFFWGIIAAVLIQKVSNGKK